MAEEKDTNFKITDRRKFNPDGTPRDAEAEMPAEPAVQAQEPEVATASDNVLSFESAKEKIRPEPQAEPQAEQAAQAESGAVEPEPSRAEQDQAAAAVEQAYNQARADGAENMPEPSFITLVDTLAAQAAMCLGIAPAPDGRQLPADMEAARHFVDMLGTLEVKTRGNLTPDENEMLQSVLAYLRLQFVELSRPR